ncbi:Uncharacterised protein [Veillonella parvula]|jgi:Zn-dependent peptidase ImmA (M78 family)|nr:Uncharacterised protein [Veillonella parvula]
MYRDIKYPYEGADSVNINLIYVKLRKTQTAILKLNEDGTYTILVNSNKPRDMQRKGILHELGHIIHDDMYNIANVDLIEHMANAREVDNVEGINFYHHVL